ncbi:MAG: 2-oxoglutarate dehydrogenase complex dihydrolipoyllysine-residue succinyltransferase [Deltaproteobacteria bacterium]|nr:2-oxoglutarate dehydrogenase complex dihydrolipoyllysine-residue succinyltransferase [Deltaproteobacteria bacterium]
MVIEIKIPGVGESVREAVLAQWLKNDGDAVKKDEPILVIETDKVSLEVAAEADGVLHILVPAGTTVPIGTVVATLAVAEGAGTSVLTPLPSSPLLHLAPGVQPAEPPPDTSPSLRPPADVRLSAPPVETTAALSHSPIHDLNQLPPSVRRLIQDKGVDIAVVTGTGPGGRITKGDVLLYLESLPAVPAGPAAPLQAAVDAPLHETGHDAGDEPTTRKTLTPIRQRIAERLVQAKQQTAMLTTFNEIDMSRVMAVRTRFKDAFQKKHGVSLGFMGFFIKAGIAALKDFPEINAFIDAKDVIYHNYYHIGIAVGSERGLVVPVLRHADRMSFADLEKAIASAVDKIASGKLGLSELEGGTFTISNGGVYGSLLSTPILNPPQSAILGMHKIEKRPVVIDDVIVIRPMMYVALSYDHRIVDGRGAVSFLKRIKECIEEPERLMMEI